MNSTNPMWVNVNIEAVVQRCSVKKVFFEIAQNSQENTCARVSFLIKLSETLKNTFSYRTPLVAASVNNCLHFFSMKKFHTCSVRKRCPYSELFCISPYSVQIWENTDQNNSKYGQFSRSDCSKYFVVIKFSSET